MSKILIVDDKESNLLALQRVFKGLDVEIIQALTGDDALRASLNHEFALAILDVQMPAMDGYELAALLRGDQRTRHVPIIFLSAVYVDDPYIFKGYTSGAVDFITKPFNPDILLSKVKVFLELDARKTEIDRQKASLEKVVAQLEAEIEARRKAEQELMKARMLEALGTLAGGIAHDFNNMLTVVLGHIDLAKISGGCNDRVHHILGQAEEAILRATELTSRFITFSGGGRPRKKTILVGRLLAESVDSALVGSSIEPELFVREDLWSIEADPRQMNQAIYVIVSNAREAMPEGGNLKIDALNYDVEAKKDNPGPAIKAGAYVKISITDQGQGIAAENMAKIFDPYFSTKERGSMKGMGLGLAIAHSIISKHDGYIQAESERGVGTSFHIYLPARLPARQ